MVTGLLTGLVIDSGDGVTHVVNNWRTLVQFLCRELSVIFLGTLASVSSFWIENASVSVQVWAHTHLVQI